MWTARDCDRQPATQQTGGLGDSLGDRSDGLDVAGSQRGHEFARQPIQKCRGSAGEFGVLGFADPEALHRLVPQLDDRARVGQRGPHPREDHGRVERFHDVVAYALTDHVHDGVAIGHARDHDHRNRRRTRVGPHASQELATVHLGHTDIADDELAWLTGLEQLQCFGSGRSLPDVDVLLHEDPLHQSS